jgi:hypothetical protein
MTCAVESVVSQLPQTLGMEFSLKIGATLKNSMSSRPKMTTKDLKTMKFFRINKYIRILQADIGNCMLVLDESKYVYKVKINTLQESGVYAPLPENPTAKIERNV